MVRVRIHQIAGNSEDIRRPIDYTLREGALVETAGGCADQMQIAQGQDCQTVPRLGQTRHTERQVGELNLKDLIARKAGQGAPLAVAYRLAAKKLDRVDDAATPSQQLTLRRSKLPF